MQRQLKTFIVYFPVILVIAQVLANLVYFIAPEVYTQTKFGFYINTFLGTNVGFAIFLVCFSFLFKFCDISRAAAIAELAFALNYLIVQQDNLYNILFQVIAGVIAIIVTIWKYTKKFPMCRWSLFWSFIHRIISTKSCSQGMEQWRRDVKSIILKKHHHAHSGIKYK